MTTHAAITLSLRKPNQRNIPELPLRAAGGVAAGDVGDVVTCFHVGFTETLVGVMVSDVGAVEALFGRRTGEPPYGCEFELRDPDGNRSRRLAS